ncbi:hypothetical protein CGSSp6BS73_04215 [Streptococcus pneumoniae SP6-BS73]|nr:hypothetical protein CGSSp6BS73_04215 [Streptococcus pneumoniae SP6-BS73]
MIKIADIENLERLWNIFLEFNQSQLNVKGNLF